MKYLKWLLVVPIIYFCGCGAENISKREISIEKKIGQMVMVGFRGTKINSHSPIAQDIKNLNIGGVILFDYDVALKSETRNISSPAQAVELVSQFQNLSSTLLFVAIDQEGGAVSRLKEKHGFREFASAEELGKLSLKNTFDISSANAAQLRSLGINFNFAPVVDVNVNSKNPVIGGIGRSFSNDPRKVANCAKEFIEAHYEKNIACAVKHFPGHGSSQSDSHVGFVDVSSCWSDKELLPYRELFEEDFALAVMTAHIFNDNLDSNWPATLSRKIITNLLRKKLGFEGVVITDDMQMGAIANNYGFANAVQRAVLAGCDMILLGNNLSYDENSAANTISIIKEMVDSGKIQKSRIDESYKRICKLKGLISQSE